MSGIDKTSTVTIAVRDENEALRWFMEKLDFEKRLDLLGPGLRWLTVAPREQKEVQFLLATWFPEHIRTIATCVVDTQDCRKTYEVLKEKPYGIEAVFPDLRATHTHWLNINPCTFNLSRRDQTHVGFFLPALWKRPRSKNCARRQRGPTTDVSDLCRRKATY